MRGLGAIDSLGIADQLRFVGPCVIAGDLFDLGEYPGLRRGEHRVIGELYALLNPDIIERLDDFEGFRPADVSSSLYLREQIELTDPGATTAWIYVYNRVPDACARIMNGDWRLHQTAQQ